MHNRIGQNIPIQPLQKLCIFVFNIKKCLTNTNTRQVYKIKMSKRNKNQLLSFLYPFTSHFAINS